MTDITSCAHCGGAIKGTAFYWPDDQFTYYCSPECAGAAKVAR